MYEVRSEVRGRKRCCGIILMHAVNMYCADCLIIKQICPIARYNKTRESQTENKNREGQSQIETPVTYPRSKMLEDR